MVLGRRGANPDGGQPQTCRLPAKEVREHPVAFEQVTQGSVRIRDPSEESPRQAAPTLDYRPAEVRRRQHPDGAPKYGEERLDEVWQQPEPLGDDAGLAREADEVFDDQAEALAPEPVESLP